ncbi:S9 family peptidase [Gaoshiqia sp. Z1-71]|uniref:S9 family peptidase n=1 Tax=Gaoshiqia hydrogeniformans TaxID=3290090 RepID=UPI003BF8F8A0
MKKTGLFLIILLISNSLRAQLSVDMNVWELINLQQLTMPVFSDTKNTDGNTFGTSDLLSSAKVNFDVPANSRSRVEIGPDSLLSDQPEPGSLVLLSGYLSVERWAKATLNVTMNAVYEIYLDDELLKSQKNAELNTNKIDLKLSRGNHRVVIKCLSPDKPMKLHALFTCDVEFADCNAVWNLNAVRYCTIRDVLEGNQLSSAKISPSGKYVLINYSEVLSGSGKSRSYSEIYDLEKKRNITVWRNKDLRHMGWLPRTDRLSYTAIQDEESELFVYDPQTGVEKSIAKGIKDLSGFRWSPGEDYIIATTTKKAEKPGDLKRIFANDDRIPGFRDRLFLHLIDVTSGNIRQLTAGNLSANLHDIKPDGSGILFSSSRTDHSETPFRKQNLYEMDIRTHVLDTVWKDQSYAGSCQYSPDGTKLLVKGGPDCFDGLGINVGEGLIPNSYDQQLYIFDLQSRQAEAMTRDFDPAVDAAYWSKDNRIYLSATYKDYKNLYRYDLKNRSFNQIGLQTDVLSDIDFAYEKPVAVYSGSGISTPKKLFVILLDKAVSSLISFPEKDRFEQIRFGESEDWNFTNRNGTTIYGRIYYPPHYDAGKKYPLIVNFYGGTTPTDRSFGGRYPKEVWAANGYLVYVLQPGGATGFGQNFSALHVNGWGLDAIDDIIEGTEKLIGAHPSVDAEHVGCIGASYGGFTTMLLQTRTGIFKTAISHAGISAISSYWGEGYWGYSYNAGAAKFSYPWNRKDIYVDNSPLYNADKFQNSILLLHGTSDTNVPVGESLQYYAALKLLGKEVEMVLVDGEDHWILDYRKRLKWHDTIMSWFDLKLKNQPQQWQELYPEKNL